MQVRAATSDDLPSILRIERESDTAAHWNERAYLAIFSGDGPLRLALVAVEDSTGCNILGFVIARSLGAEWEIENLAVAAAHRQRGVGLALVLELLRELRCASAEAVLLEVRESNLAAGRLYEKAGFIQEGRRPGYYHRPTEDALLLRFVFQ